MNYEQIGKRVKRERIKLHLTQKQLADLIGVSTYFIGNVERGERGLSLEVAEKLIHCFHISFDYLILGSKDLDVKEGSDELDLMLLKCSSDERIQITEVVRTIFPRLRK